MFTNQYPKSYQRGPAQPFASPARNAEVRAMAARYAGVCRACRGPIAVGETILFSRDTGAVHQTCPARESAPAVVNVTAEPARLAVEDAGVYVLPDGAIVKVQANKERTRTYAKRWVHISGERLTEAGTREHGEYQYEAGLVDQVAREGRKMTLEEAKAFILRYGICARCSRVLKAADSVERGIGPICWKFFAGHEH